MRNRKTFKRVCKICNKEEFVRSDQLKMSCKECKDSVLGEKIKDWVKNNKEKHLETASKANLKHGLWQKRIYKIYGSMLNRCGHRNYVHKYSKYYADRGIRVCDEWVKDKIKFFNWAFDNGYNDNLQIDRIDPDKGYSPDNCRWITPLENQKNRRDRRLTSPSS